MADDKRPVCAVVGVGPGNGEALARRFAADGYAVALMARRAELTAKLATELPRAKVLCLRCLRGRLDRGGVRRHARRSRRRRRAHL